MNDKQRQQMIEQAVGKVRWAATEKEVMEWLTLEKGVDFHDAQEIYQTCLKEKRKAVRERALIHLAFSAFGLVFSVTLVLLQLFGRFVVIGFGSILVIGLGFTCSYWTIKNLKLLFTGEKDGAVDL